MHILRKFPQKNCNFFQKSQKKWKIVDKIESGHNWREGGWPLTPRALQQLVGATVRRLFWTHFSVTSPSESPLLINLLRAPDAEITGDEDMAAWRPCLAMSGDEAMSGTHPLITDSLFSTQLAWASCLSDFRLWNRLGVATPEWITKECQNKERWRLFWRDASFSDPFVCYAPISAPLKNVLARFLP